MRVLASVAAAALLLLQPALGLQRSLGEILNERRGDVKFLGGLLDEHVSNLWETLDRQYVDLEDTASFSIQLKQCNLERLKELLEKEVSNPRHDNYQEYWNSEQINEAVSCGSPTEKAKLEIPKWLVKNGVSSDQIKTTNSYIRVEHATVAQIESLFDVEMLYHQHKANGKTLLRARGILTMPNAIAEHVTFISGLTELLTPVKNSVSHPSDSNESPYAQALSAGDGLASYYSPGRKNPPLSPRLIRRLYNLRQNLTGGTAANNSLGIAAFDDYFFEDDLCYASDLFGRDPVNGIYTVPSVDYNGPLNGTDDFESSLDIQFATNLAPGVSASFWNHGGDEWILTWAQQAVNEITGSNGPWVWSLSYGWPEVGHCVSGALPLDTALCFGIDYKQYIETTNNELMKLALMGVTVFVSSGDAGSPGFTIYCPVDPSKPSAFGGSLVTSCPSSNPADCKCGSITLSYLKDGVDTPCFLPQALGGDIVNGQTGGFTSCTLLDFNNADIIEGLFTVLNEWVTDINGSCTTSFNATSFTFGSLCTCDQLPTRTYAMTINMTSGETVNVTLSGYQYKTSYSQSMFFPDYPTASPYVVSVGATQVDPFDTTGACGQSPKEIFSSILSGAFISGGGGFSVVSPQPSWQSSAVSTYLKTGLAPPSDYFNSSNRAYPDISLNGHNYPVVVAGQVTGVDGTSASSPTLAAIFALMNEVLLSHGKKPLGLLTPLLYQMAADEPTAFNKITPTTDSAGNVYGADNTCTESYCCQYGYKTSSSGWDPVTGLGTPNMAVIENYIRKINGLPSIAQEAAALAPATTTPTQAPTTAATTASPTTAAAADAGASTKTVTTAGATVMVILAFFFGVLGTLIYFKTRKPADTSDSKAVLLSGR